MLTVLGSDHHQFMRDLSSKLSSIFTAILSAEETRRRAERLEKQLADSMKQSQYMAECASVGMARISPDGIIRWANPEFYSITGHTREEDSQYFSFLDVYVDEDRPKALNVWTCLMAGQNNLSEELKLKRLYQPPTGDAEPARVLCNSSARVEDGKLQTVFLFITDVSNFRWAEASEARKAIQAEEAKRQQEEFIDFVSHELRNPLSAIFQLAETIVTSFPVSEHGTNTSSGELAEAIRGNIDNANTIIMCGM
jgi:signal transduction histidine kinase